MHGEKQLEKATKLLQLRKSISVNGQEKSSNFSNKLLNI